MLIYFLYKDPALTVGSLCLHTQLACINTYTQILSNAHLLCGTDSDEPGMLPARNPTGTYTQWTARSEANYRYLYECTLACLQSYRKIYGKGHARARLGVLNSLPETAQKGWTMPPLGQIPMAFRSNFMEDDPGYVYLCYQHYYCDQLEKALEENKYNVEYLTEAPAWMPRLKEVPNDRVIKKADYEVFSNFGQEIPANIEIPLRAKGVKKYVLID